MNRLKRMNILWVHQTRVAVNYGSNRVNRGGSWNNNARNCRSANRNNNDPDNRNNDLGFRLLSSLSCQKCIVYGWCISAWIMTRPLSSAGICRTKKSLLTASGRNLEGGGGFFFIHAFTVNFMQ
jgi:hypothetical protein